MKEPRYYKRTTNLEGWRRWKKWLEVEFEKLKKNESYKAKSPDIRVLLKDALGFWKEDRR